MFSWDTFLLPHLNTTLVVSLFRTLGPLPGFLTRLILGCYRREKFPGHDTLVNRLDFISVMYTNTSRPKKECESPLVERRSSV